MESNDDIHFCSLTVSLVSSILDPQVLLQVGHMDVVVVLMALMGMFLQWSDIPL